MTTENQVTGTLNGVKFPIEKLSVTHERHTKEMAKEYKMEYFPDEYGGIYVPVAVDAYDTEQVVTGKTTTGRLVAGAGFPYTNVWGGETVTIDIDGDDHINSISDAVLTDVLDAKVPLVELRFTDYEPTEDEV